MSRSVVIVAFAMVFVTVALMDTTANAQSGSTSRYFFIGPNTAEHQTARADCYDVAAVLLSVKTPLKRAQLNSFLVDSDDTGIPYWTSGRYNIVKQIFEWENGEPFADWIPWSPGHPGSKLLTTRVIVVKVGISLQFQTQSADVSNNYICDLF